MKTNYVEIGGVDSSFVAPFLRHLVKVGLSEKNPISGGVVIFDKDGKQVSINSISEIIYDACSGVQMWVDQFSDIYISWERPDAGIEVFLDGLEEGHVIRVAGICCLFSCDYSVKNEAKINIALGSDSE